MRTESDQEINTMEIIKKYAAILCRTGSWELVPGVFEEPQEDHC